jgi:hypothetical protein
VNSLRYSEKHAEAVALAADIKEARKNKKKTKKTFVSIKFIVTEVYLNKLIVFNLQVRNSLLTSNQLASAQSVREIVIDPLPTFNKKNLQGVWLYESGNPFPSRVPAREAGPLLPIIVQKNEEVIIRDRATGKVVLAVYRNRIGTDALEIMQNTIKEMMQVRRKVARSGGISKLNQGSMAAAGYIYCSFQHMPGIHVLIKCINLNIFPTSYLATRECGVFTHVFNMPKELRGTEEQYLHEQKVVAMNGLLFNYAMGIFPPMSLQVSRKNSLHTTFPD